MIWLVIGLFVPLILWGSFYSLVTSGFFEVSQIQINIEGSIDHQALFQSELEQLKVKMQSLAGENIWDIQVDEMAQSFLPVAWIQDFIVLKSWPNQVTVMIQLAPLLFAIKEKKTYRLFFGSQKWSEAENELTQELQVPIVVTTEKKISQDTISNVYHLLDLLKGFPSLQSQNIKTIYWDSTKGFKLKLRDPNSEVLLGFIEDPDKLVRVTRVIEYLKQHKIEARVIDSNFTKKVLVRLRNQL